MMYYGRLAGSPAHVDFSFVADQKLASELAEIGVALLLFGVGLHFSIRYLVAVRHIAIPGAPLQMAATTFVGMTVSRFAFRQPRRLRGGEGAVLRRPM
jgi:predicted Kef-type K+ transport protein